MKKYDETADVKSTRKNNHDLWFVISSATGVRGIPIARGPRVMIGRLHTCDVVIEDDSVSRQHAVVHNTPHGLFIEDLQSRNKTKVMGRALGRGENAPLQVGSVVEVGNATMFVQTGPPGVVPHHPLDAPPSVRQKAVIIDPTMLRLYALLDVIAPSPLNVLVLGETGTGKEVFAEAIHIGSRRSAAPFLRVNCAALSGSLLESELFGHEKGAFTGALGAKAGLFEAAHGGTVFLDEVGELPLDSQAKLLRVIERGEVIRLGSVTPRRIDVRYVAATNRGFSQEIAEGRFRQDLYFRLNGFTVTIPPLRKRIREVVALARYFIERAAEGRPYDSTIGAQSALEAYPWPGNVRELKNVVERALVLSGAQARIEASHLQLPEVEESVEMRDIRSPADTIPPTPYASGNLPGTAPPPPLVLNEASLRTQRESFERQQILSALEKTSGNQKEAAILLGVSRRTLINKIEAYGIARPRKR